MNVQTAYEFLKELREDFIQQMNKEENKKKQSIELSFITANEIIEMISKILNPNSEMDDIGKAREVLSKGYRGKDADRRI